MGLAKSTIENYISPLSQAFEYAIQLGYIKDNPCTRITYPKDFEKAKDREVITLDQYNTIMQGLENLPHFQLAVMIGLYAGLRISETFGLTWDNIDFENKTITVNKQIVKRNFGVDVRRAYKVKGKKEDNSSWYFSKTKTKTSNRTIVVSDELINALRKWKNNSLKTNYIMANIIKNCT